MSDNFIKKLEKRVNNEIKLKPIFKGGDDEILLKKFLNKQNYLNPKNIFSIIEINFLKNSPIGYALYKNESEIVGFLGTIFILVLFITLIMISIYISIKSSHLFGRILSAGVGTNLFLYVVFNMSMVTGLMPVVGIPLPLLSYGGTAMLSIMISFGLLMNIQVNQDLKKIS